MGSLINKRSAQGRTDGVAVAAGYVGETPGGVARAGTGGSAYTIRSTTAAGSGTPAKVIFQSVNKGTYLVTISSIAASSSAAGIGVQGRIGGTQVTSEFGSYNGVATAFASGTVCFVAVITTDSTEIQGYAYMTSGTVSSSSHEMSIVRIA